MNGNGVFTTEDAEEAEDGGDWLTGEIISAGMAVHSALGAGLMESVYETCLYQELREKGLRVERQLQLPIRYKGSELTAGYRVDLLVEDRVIVELKSVDKLLPIHKAQALTYLKLSGKRVALLLNFNVPHLREGIERLVM